MYYVLAGSDSWDPEQDEALYRERGEAFDRWLAEHDAQVIAEALQAAKAEVNRLTECLEAMNASADILDEKIRVLSGSNQRDADLRQCPKCGGDRLRTDFTRSGYCHAPYQRPTEQE
jgi:hypothetical protein